VLRCVLRCVAICCSVLRDMMHLQRKICLLSSDPYTLLDQPYHLPRDTYLYVNGSCHIYIHMYIYIYINMYMGLFQMGLYLYGFMYIYTGSCIWGYVTYVYIYIYISFCISYKWVMSRHDAIFECQCAVTPARTVCMCVCV